MTIHNEKTTTIRPHGKLNIRHETPVSWLSPWDAKVKEDSGRSNLSFSLANNVEMSFSLSEFYDSAKTGKMVGKETMFSINQEEAKAIIKHLQAWVDKTES